MTTGSSPPKATAIVLARSGSRGVPGKNVASVGGRPCLAWTLDHARAARGVARVVLSTDDPAAAAVARAMGCAVVDRPPDLAGDLARVDDAARHAALRPAADGEGPLLILYANVPIRPPGLLDRALDLLVASGCDSVQSYVPVGKVHPWWLVRLDAEGAVSPWEGDVLNRGVFRRQDLPPAYVPDGGVIALTRDALHGRVPGVPAGPHAFFGRDRRGVVTAPGDVVDIDSPIDLELADAILRQHAPAPAPAPAGAR